MKNLIKKYIQVEKRIQDLVLPIASKICCDCKKICCKEIFCRESLESSFLSLIVKPQNLEYTKKGWLGEKGCRLKFGRPPICYEYFCGKFYEEGSIDFDSKKHSSIPEIVNDFVTFGDNACSIVHLICVDNLDLISSEKIQEMKKSLNAINKKLDRVRF